MPLGPWVGTVLRAVRSRTDVRITNDYTAARRATPYLNPWSTEPMGFRASHSTILSTGQPVNGSTNPVSFPAHWPTVQLINCWQRLSSLRSDQPRLFGDRIELMLQEVDFDLQVRDLPRQFFVLDDELLEEGKDLFVGSVVVHGSDAWCVRSSHSAAGTRTTERRRIKPGRAGERPEGLILKARKTPGSQRELNLHG